MARPYVLPVPVQAPLGLDRLDTTYITDNQLMVLIASVSLLIIAWFLINRTRLGLAWRATEQDFETASAFGVHIDRAVASNFFLGSAVAGAAGVLVDEGSTGLMPIFVDKVFDAFGELHRRGVSILLVEQNARKSLSTMSRGYVLETGRISLEGSPEELKSNPEVQRAYLGI